MAGFCPKFDRNLQIMCQDHIKNFIPAALIVFELSQQEAIFINVIWLRKEIEFEGLFYQPSDYEEKIKSLIIHHHYLISSNKFQQHSPTKRTTASCSLQMAPKQKWEQVALIVHSETAAKS
ncbi:hypothetical protein AVEN_50788-1 [Araneus ventricosus]|uniref:Uncharacterized protein n=1 Tax=Araneus ventricosus TaxID=182803 RepID=A0A4Y2U3X4_ARAVE|nr:hypothetical protein AVEN_50788-1 [Araneus ventricosus]